ncbi:MAG TPA: nucleotide modification associated domain-containing protein [Candidatus Paceibacterota bacterium]|nr:nucleotide modification associated domain-containing protein [Candidatus Paceibacterota bacterium]
MNKIDLKKDMGYNKALNMVLEVRADRQKQYGDNWRTMDEIQFLGLMKNKIMRLETMFLTKRPMHYENKKDALIDLVNYALFYLQLEIEKKDKK